ncbi:bifunctional polynucleotide phosphatase/kinase-like isoform X2 [Liolophura sinensis]
MKCFLLCKDNSHDPIPLPDGCPVYIGRNPLTKIVDKRCSRQQLEFIADYKNLQVIVKQLGGNSSAVGSKELNEGETVTLTDGTTVYVLSGLYPHLIRFSETSKTASPHMKTKPLTKVSSESSDSRKRKSSESESLSRSNSKKLKKEVVSVVSMEDNKDDSDTEIARVKEVKEKLKQMKQAAKGEQKAAEVIPAKKEVKAVPSRCGKPASDSSWSQFDKLLMYIGKGVEARSKVAGFDIDGTIIGTVSGKVFPTHPGDWKILYGEIPTKLKRLHNDGYKVVFFTNQLGVERGKTKVEDLKTKFAGVVKRVDVPVQILVSTGSGVCRKPATGMWDFLSQQANDGIEVDIDTSFYVGDAAGRADKWSPGKKKDFSCSDRLFALNIGLKFFTPEEYFQGWKPAPFKLPEFNPNSLRADNPLTSPPDAKIISKNQEVVITVGFPASGKSFFVKTYMVKEGYIHVNRDKLGSWQKCVAACTKSLQQNHKVVVDNTSPDKESRKRYLDVAKKFNVPCRCFYFTASLQQARHNERFRSLTDKLHKPINDMVMNSYKSKFEEPSVSEGFTQVIKINFVPKFTDLSHEKLFFQYLMDK